MEIKGYSETEKWKFYLNETSNYMISNYGNVKSFKKDPEGKVLKKITSVHGYIKYLIYQNGAIKLTPAHRMVAQMFLPNPLNKPFVNHIDGDKTNNFIGNLEWCTRSENGKHAFKIGLSKISDAQRFGMSERAKKRTGILSPVSKKVLNYKTGETFNSIKEAADREGIKQKTLSAMLSGQNKNKTNLKYL